MAHWRILNAQDNEQLMKTKIAIVLSLLICLPVLGFTEPAKVWRRGDPPPKGGWVWPKLEEVFVYASARKNESGNYDYSYVISNSIKNTFALNRFEVDLRNNPVEHPFTREDVTLTHDMYAHRKVLDNTLRVKPIEVVRPEKWNRQLPAKWQEEYRNDPVWTTTDAGFYYQLKPGEKVSGFGMIAKDPPGIREFIVDADDMEYFEAMLANPLPPEKAYLAENPDQLDLEVNKGTTYSSKTIAPVAPSEPFTVSSWTARMESDAVEARALGWIKTDKTLADIEKLVDELKNANPAVRKSAVGKIGKYILSEKKKGNLTNEADALVRLNAQYLLYRLEKPEEK